MLKKIANSTANGLVNNFTIANLITVCGLIIDLWNNYLIFNGVRGMFPLLLLWAVPLTDFFDGLFARRRNAETWVGCALDPIRDKVYSCSKFYFMIVSFLALLSLFPLLIPLTIIIYAVLAFLEFLLFCAGIYGTLKGYEIKANDWGKNKMGWECGIISVIWGPVFLTPSWGTSMNNLFVLVILTALPIVPIYYALKSLNGHISVFKGATK